MVKSVDRMMYNINILNEQNNKVNNGLSTNDALEYGSDDSIRYDYLTGVQSDIRTYESISETINYNKVFNTSSDSTLDDIKSDTDAIIGELIKANTSTVNEDGLLIISEQIESYKDSLLTLANTSVNGEYLFSGVNTQTESFEVDSEGNITYQSDNSIKTLNVEKNKYVPQGVNGIDVFYYTNQTITPSDNFTFEENEIILDESGNQWQLMDSDLDGTMDGLFLDGDITSSSLPVIDNTDGTFSATNSLSNDFEIKHSIFDDLNLIVAALKGEDLEGNSIASGEVDSILNETIENINLAYDSQLVAHSLVGTRTVTINNYLDIVDSKKTNLEVLEKEYGQADLTELAIKAQALENTYTALYSTINRVNSLSLVNYLS